MMDRTKSNNAQENDSRQVVIRNNSDRGISRSLLKSGQVMKFTVRNKNKRATLSKKRIIPREGPSCPSKSVSIKMVRKKIKSSKVREPELEALPGKRNKNSKACLGKKKHASSIVSRNNNINKKALLSLAGDSAGSPGPDARIENYDLDTNSGQCSSEINCDYPSTSYQFADLSGDYFLNFNNSDDCSQDLYQGFGPITKSYQNEIIPKIKGYKGITEQTASLRDLAEKLAVASAYTFVGNSILKKSDVNRLSSALVHVINSQPDLSGKKSKNRNSRSAASSSRTSGPDNGDSSHDYVSYEQFSEVIALACNCLSCIIEESMSDAKIIVCNGAVKALVKRLNDKTYICSIEHIVNVLHRLSEAYPASLVSKDVQIAIIRSIDFVETYVQRTVLKILSNVIMELQNLEDNQKKYARDLPAGRPASFSELIKDIDMVFGVMGKLLSSRDEQLVECAVDYLYRIVEWCSEHKYDVAPFFDVSTIKRLVDLLAISIGFPQGGELGLQYLEIADSTNNRNSNQTSRIYFLIVRIINLLSKNLPKIRMILVKDLGILEILFYCLTLLEPEEDKSNICKDKLRCSIISNSFKINERMTFEALSLLTDLIESLPNGEELICLAKSGGSKNYKEEDKSDTIIVDSILAFEPLVQAIIERLDTSYNFYISYKSMEFLLKILLKSTNIGAISRLMACHNTIRIITFSCLSIGTSYYFKRKTRRCDVRELEVDENFTKGIYENQKLALLECGLIFNLLIISRCGEKAAKAIERSGSGAYISQIVKILNRKFGEYAKHTRNSDSALVPHHKPSVPQKIRESRSNISVSNGRKKQHRGLEGKTKASTTNKSNDIPSMLSRVCKIIIGRKKKASKDLDEDTTSLQNVERFIFNLCKEIEKSIIEIPKEELGQSFVKKLRIIGKKFKDNEEVEVTKSLNEFAQMITSEDDPSVTVLEMLKSGIISDLITYINSCTGGLAILDMPEHFFSNMEGLSSTNPFLQVFLSSPESQGSGKYYVPGAFERLVHLLNQCLDTINIFPFVCADNNSLFSIPLKSCKLMDLDMNNFTETSISLPLHPETSSVFEHYSTQLNGNILIKLRDLDKSDLRKLKLSVNILSSFDVIESYLKGLIHERKVFSSNAKNKKTRNGILLVSSNSKKRKKSSISSEFYCSDDEICLKDTNQFEIETDSSYEDLTKSSGDYEEVRTKSDEACEYSQQGNWMSFWGGAAEENNKPAFVDLTEMKFPSILQNAMHSCNAIFDIDPAIDFGNLDPNRVSYSLRRRAKRSNQELDNDGQLELLLCKTPVKPNEMILTHLHQNNKSYRTKCTNDLLDITHELSYRIRKPLGKSITSTPQSPHIKKGTWEILCLLRFLFYVGRRMDPHKFKGESGFIFLNSMQTVKALKQLQEPIVVFAKLIPKECDKLLTDFKFLFPFELRKYHFEIKSFHMMQVAKSWKERFYVDMHDVEDEGENNDIINGMGSVPRLRVKINRSKFLETAIHILNKCDCARSELTIEYADEVGLGLGPTLEFYTNVFQEIQKLSYSTDNSGILFPLWRVQEFGDSSTDSYICSPTGLFPAPLPEFRIQSMKSKVIYRRMLNKNLCLFEFMGAFVAKSIMDSRLINFPLNRLFVEMVLVHHDNNFWSSLKNIETVKRVDPAFYKSLKALEVYIIEKNNILNNPDIPGTDKLRMISDIRVDGKKVEDMYLNFTLPGYPHIELFRGGSDVDVTINNLDEYLNEVIDYTVHKGIYRQVSMFRKGFNSIFPTENMKFFYEDEILSMISDDIDCLTYEDVISSIRTHHGYTISSPTVMNFASVVSELNNEDRYRFIKFVTGSTRFPINGIRMLVPPLTIVKKDTNGKNPDDYLPSVMTCANYIKLPDYSSIDVIRSRLCYAIREGLESFHLS